MSLLPLSTDMIVIGAALVGASNAKFRGYPYEKSISSMAEQKAGAGLPVPLNWKVISEFSSALSALNPKCSEHSLV